MKIIIDKIPPGATLGEVIQHYNTMVDKLNLAFSEIDEENFSESVVKKITAKEDE